MKIRFYFTMAFCFVLPYLTFSQSSYNFYYDAKSMDVSISNDTGKNAIMFFKLLKSYVPSYGYINLAEIKSEFRLNPFIDTSTFFSNIDTALYYLVKKEIYNSLPKGLSAKGKDSTYTYIKNNWRKEFENFATEFNGLNFPDTANENKEYKSVKKNIDSLQEKNYGVPLTKGNRSKVLIRFQDSLKSEYDSTRELINYVNILLGTGIITYNSIQKQLINFQNQSLIIYNVHKELDKISFIDSQNISPQLETEIGNIIKYADGISRQINNEINLIRPKFAMALSIHKKRQKLNLNNTINNSTTDPTLTSNIVSSSTLDLASNSTTPSSGSLESDAIYAVAGLIADRFKDELDAYFMQVFDSTLNKSLLLKQLLPQTVHLLASDDIISFVNKPSLVQNAFQKDLSNILPDLDSYIQMESKKELNNSTKVNSEDSKQLEDSLIVLCNGLILQDSLIAGKRKLKIARPILMEEEKCLNDFNLHFHTLTKEQIYVSIKDIRDRMYDFDAALFGYPKHRFFLSRWFKPDRNKNDVKGLRSLRDQLLLKRDFMVLADKSILQHIHLLFTLIEKIKSSNNPADAVSILGDTTFTSQISNNKNFQSSCKLGFIVSNGLRAKAKTKLGWVSCDSLNTLNDNERMYFLTLFYEKIKNIPFVLKKGNAAELSQMLNTADASVLFSYIKEFSNIVSTIDQYHSKDGNMSKSDSLSLNNFLGYYKTISNLITILYSPPLDSNEITVITKDVKKLDTISDRMITLYSDINQRSWNKIAGDLVYLLQAAMGDKFQDSPALIKYGTFASSVASAKNSDDIKNAIVSIALPPGSYSIKRRSVSNISINSYAGLEGSANLFYKPGGYFKTGTLSNYKIGLSAPVGISFTWGKRTPHASREIASFTKSDGQMGYLRGMAWTVFISAIDLGSIVQVNLSNSQSTVPSQLSIQQFISPGIFGLYDFKNCPLSLIFGFSIRPQLASSFNTGITQPSESAYINQASFNLGLLVDIPLLNIKTITDQQYRRSYNQ